MTIAEIDSIALAAGCKAAARPSDADILTDSPWNAHLALTERQAMWRDREMAVARRMVAALASRYGWTDAQSNAAVAVALDIPTSGVKGRRMYPADSIAVFTEAARRAA